MKDGKKIDINNYNIIGQLNSDQYNRIKQLIKLNFKESELGEFYLKGIKFTLEELESSHSQIRINEIVMNLDTILAKNSARTCFTCKLSTVCFAHKELKEILTKLPVNLNGNEAPLKREEVFNSLAGCCLMYEENK
jgi:hypothetical protein